jgi:hypothetical protein
MDTPPPVNLNNPALIALLTRSKKLMEKVENNDYTTGHVDSRALNEDGVRQMQNEGVVRPQSMASNSSVSEDYTDEQVRNSKLPQAIKDAMINKKIPKASMNNSAFSLENVSEMLEQEKPMGFVKQQTRKPVTENVISNNTYSSNSDMITISKSELKSMINESLAQFFKQSYDKTLTEDAIKKTINMLIKEGKISVKQK